MTSDTAPTAAYLSLDEAADALRASGFRAEAVRQPDGTTLIQSAAQGLGFVLIPGNPAPEASERFIDYSFSCLIQLQGPIGADVVARWNQQKRFARLFATRDRLVLSLDVFIGADHGARQLRAHAELWDRLLNEFIAYLRAPAAAA